MEVFIALDQTNDLNEKAQLILQYVIPYNHYIKI
jgi:hypothetical protein